MFTEDTAKRGPGHATMHWGYNSPAPAPWGKPAQLTVVGFICQGHLGPDEQNPPTAGNRAGQDKLLKPGSQFAQSSPTKPGYTWSRFKNQALNKSLPPLSFSFVCKTGLHSSIHD